MKRIIAMLLVAVCLLSGCSGAKTEQTAQTVRIVATVFPPYDWVRQIIGTHIENIELTMLLDNGVDLHSYQPTADDIVKITGCDLFIYVGGESDKWVADVLGENSSCRTLSLLEAIGDMAKEEEQVEGMQPEEEGEEGEEEGPELDEHVWLSLRNAETLCTALCEQICDIDADNAEDYRANTDAYIAQLQALDEDYLQAVSSSTCRTLLFGDRFPFRYLTEDYGLSYYAAFSGCSAETEASFETILFLADKVDALGLSAILQLEGSDGSIAATIREETETKDQQILTVDSLQSVTASAVGSGANYLAIMRNNLEVFRTALQQKED